MSRQARILLVDDRVENLIALDAILSSLNQILVPVRSGEQALLADSGTELGWAKLPRRTWRAFASSTPDLRPFRAEF